MVDIKGLLGGPLNWLGQPVNQQYPDINRGQAMGMGLSDLAGHMSAMSRGQPYRPQFHQQMRRTGLVNAKKRDMLAQRALQERRLAEQKRQFGLSHGLSKDRFGLEQERFDFSRAQHNDMEGWRASNFELAEERLRIGQERLALEQSRNTRSEEEHKMLIEQNEQKRRMNELAIQRSEMELERRQRGHAYWGGGQQGAAPIAPGPTVERAEAGIPLAGAPQGINDLPGTASGGLSPEANEIGRTVYRQTLDPDAASKAATNFMSQQRLAETKPTDAQKNARRITGDPTLGQAYMALKTQAEAPDALGVVKDQFARFMDAIRAGNKAEAMSIYSTPPGAGTAGGLSVALPEGFSTIQDPYERRRLEREAGIDKTSGRMIVRDESGRARIYNPEGFKNMPREKAVIVSQFKSGLPRLPAAMDYFGKEDHLIKDKVGGLFNQGEWAKYLTDVKILSEGIVRGLTGAAMRDQEVEDAAQKYVPAMHDTPWRRRAKLRLLQEQSQIALDTLLLGEGVYGTSKETETALDAALERYEQIERANDNAAPSSGSYKILD